MAASAIPFMGNPTRGEAGINGGPAGPSVRPPSPRVVVDRHRDQNIAIPIFCHLQGVPPDNFHSTLPILT